MSGWVKLAERLVSAVERLADAAEAIAGTLNDAEPTWRRSEEIHSKDEVLVRR